ncbi:MAG: hypothetical protein U0326_20600 [Polyangiales bacterium]
MWVTACIDEAERLAAKAQKAERAAKAPTVDLDHEQAIVDRWDGINLILIEQIIRAFAKKSAPRQGRSPASARRPRHAQGEARRGREARHAARRAQQSPLRRRHVAVSRGSTQQRER